MPDRRRDSAAWGAVAGLLFLVLVQGIQLTGGSLPVSTLGKFGLGFALAGLTGALAYVLQPRLAPGNESP